jgi:hypothetical protein
MMDDDDDDDDDTLFLSVFCALLGRSIGMGALIFSGHDACCISAQVFRDRRVASPAGIETRSGK